MLKHHRSRHHPLGRFLLIPVLLGCCAGCKLSEDNLIEKPLGKLAKLGIETQFDMIQDPLLRDYVRHVGETEVKLAARRQKVPYNFHVVDTDQVNAFAIPWGGVYVTYGLLKAAETEDELAAVMGHEIGHVEGRHAVRSVKNQIWGQVLLSLLRGQVSDDAMTALQVAGMFVSLKYSRDQEYDADRRGLEIAYKSYYDPYGEVVFFERLRQLYGDQPRFFSYFSTHPLHRDRIRRALKQPELSEQNAAPLTHIAMGYARRGMYAPAIAHYEQALAVDPGHIPAYLGLAQAAAARGERTRARQAYRMVLQYASDHPQAREELSSLESRSVERPVRSPRADLPALVATARTANEKLLQSLRVESREIKESLERASQDDERVRQSMEITASLLQELHTIQGGPTFLEDLIGYGYRVLNRAYDAVSILDFSQEETVTTAEQLVETHQAWAHFLEQPLHTVGDVALVERFPAMAQVTQEALAELHRAVSEIHASQKRIQQAHYAAAAAIQGLHRAFYLHGSPGRGSFGFRQALDDAERQTLEALERTRGIARATATGRARAYQVGIDVLLAGSTSAQQRIAAGLIQHFLILPEEQVKAFLDRGHSFGETALLLAGARSRKSPPEEWAPAGLTYDNLVPSLQERRVPLAHLNVMLKFLTNALKAEMDEASYQENSRTWAMEA